MSTFPCEDLLYNLKKYIDTLNRLYDSIVSKGIIQIDREYNIVSWYLTRADWEFVFSRALEYRCIDEENLLVMKKQEAEEKFEVAKGLLPKQVVVNSINDTLYKRASYCTKLVENIEVSDPSEISLIFALRTQIQVLLDVCQSENLPVDFPSSKIIDADNHLKLAYQSNPNLFNFALQSGNSDSKYGERFWWWNLRYN